MKIVPINRLLLQPTIQQQWLDQNGEIEFELAEGIQKTYQQAWQLFQTGGFQTLAQFVSSEEALAFELHERDEVISLLVGADHMAQRYENFHQKFFQPNLVWSNGEEVRE